MDTTEEHRTQKRPVKLYRLLLSQGRFLLAVGLKVIYTLIKMSRIQEELMYHSSIISILVPLEDSEYR